MKLRTIASAFTKHSLIIALFSSIAISPVMADKATEKMIEARQGYYQMVRHNFAPLAAMAKGEIDYDAEKAQAFANNLKILSTLDNGTLFLPGSSKEEMPGKTRALKKIWDTYPEVAKAGKKYKEAVNNIADNAGKGLDALRANVRKVGSTCKGCHDEYRAEKF